ncbi:hypothetical protein [Deinococcus roseus]|uniref:Uncharacterized protein n=1 Tax=Deinococcus roseus TaxID=392414 RepID=A0ABQ2D990_9DEIO|nr:hypothetical protein [Deinococcus roseus]GGJ50136.1 hypothetical protein GCM10008938_40100 [Deinococcus roseus]
MHYTLDDLDFDFGALCFLTREISDNQKQDLLNRGILIARCTFPDHEGIFVPDEQLKAARSILNPCSVA